MDIIEFDNQKFYKTKYEGYYVSKEGNIVSIKVKGGNGKIDYNNPRYHCVKVDKDGYYEVLLSNNGVRTYMRLHRLIWETFNGPIGDLTIDHIDANPQNNNLSNLQLLTREANTSKAKKDKPNNRRFMYKVYEGETFIGVFSRRELENKYNFSNNFWFKSQNKNNVIIFECRGHRKDNTNEKLMFVRITE